MTHRPLRRFAENSQRNAKGHQEADVPTCQQLEQRLLLSVPPLLGVSPGYPQIGYDSNGSLDYERATGLLAVNCHVVGFQASSGARPVTIPATATVQIQFYAAPDGTLVGGVSGPDLLIQGTLDADRNGTIDYSGDLLTGELLAYGALETGTASDQYDFHFRPTGGAMAGFFSGQDIGVRLTSILSTFEGSFENSFDGRAQGTIGPIAQLPASLGDFVWKDANTNGIQDAGELGIAGVTVKLLNASNAVVGTTATDANGAYLFSGLTPGDYKVEFIAPSNFTFSPPNQGANDAADSDADVTTGRTAVTTLVSGENDMTWDAGLYQIATLSSSLGDFVWHDTYHGCAALVDGIQNFGEKGLAGVVVNLLDAQGNFEASTVTDGTGFYIFGGLDAGTYFVEVAASNFVGTGTLADHWYASPANRGANDAVDSDGSTVTHRTGAIILDAGEVDLTNDFGFFQTGIDLTKTSTQQEVQAGQTITYHFVVTNTGDVVEHGGAHVYDAMLNPCGNHEIWAGVLQPGQTVQFDRTYQTKAPTQCADGDVGTLVNTSTAVGHPIGPEGALPLVTDTSSVTVQVVAKQAAWEGLTPGYWKQCQHFDDWVGFEQRDSYDTVFGVNAPGCTRTLLQSLQLGGGGEQALARHAVAALLNAANPKINYFYTVDEVIAMVQQAYRTGQYEQTKNLLAAQNELELSGGGSLGGGGGCGGGGGTGGGCGTALSSIAGFVYLDKDNDGRKDCGESGIAGVTIVLSGVDDWGRQVRKTLQTNRDGKYNFTGLKAGTYAVTESQPCGYRDGKDTVGSAGGSVSNDRFSQIDLLANMKASNYNFGERTRCGW